MIAPIIHDSRAQVCQREEDCRHSHLNKVWPSVRFVRLNLPGYFIPVRTNVAPGVSKVFGAQRRIIPQKVSLGNSQPPRLLQKPDGNSRADDAGFPAANAGAAFDSGEGIRSEE